MHSQNVCRLFNLANNLPRPVMRTESRLQIQMRFKSTSPYGRTHVWKRRPPVLPNPIVPRYPQTVIRSDGTSFVQWTTSPKSLVRLTRDTTNNPAWNTGAWSMENAVEEETGSAGRLGRFSRKFGTSRIEESVGVGLDDVKWMEEMLGGFTEEQTQTKPKKESRK